MDSDFDPHKISLLRNLFRSREDVFALYWNKGKKSGYMPAYQFDPYMYQLHSRRGGSFKDYKDKTYLPLTDQQIIKHLQGQQLMGIYPLMQDNTSFFIAADFDKENWMEESLTFLKSCFRHGIPAYLERSRSGNGAHVWVFFEKAYPAVKSRAIVKVLLEESGIISTFHKSSSFDRLFPNQDFLSGKGFGNLIALPFYGPAVALKNSIFLNHNSDELEPYPNQWDFLSTIKKVAPDQLDRLYRKFFEVPKTEVLNAADSRVQVFLGKEIRLNKVELPPALINFLKNELNIPNTEFFINKKAGKSTRGLQAHFNCIEEEGHHLLIPRGFAGRLIRFCRSNHIPSVLVDQRQKLPQVTIPCSAEMRSHQMEALKAASVKDYGIISAPPGTGKTVMALKIIADKKQPALIILHRKHLMEQWMERIEAFFGIPKKKIGRIAQGKVKIGEMVTVALIQSLGKKLETSDSEKIVSSFGTVVVDECHHMPSKTFSSSISKLAPYYQYGFTATPFRKGSDGKLISIYLGETIAEIKPQDVENYQRPRIIIRNTNFEVPFDSKTDSFETLSKILIHDSARNQLIIKDVVAQLNSGRRAIIITERKDHIDTLNQFLKFRFETITLSGDDSEPARTSKMKLLTKGLFQVLITTGQFFGEGSDLQGASCLFLVYPFSFKGKLIQYVGRVQRTELTPLIYDYRDHKIPYLDRLFLKRNRHYRLFDKQATLFEEVEEYRPALENIIIEATIRVPIENLDFRFGAVGFVHKDVKSGQELEFEIENFHLRPEFDVLKAYFAKIINSKSVAVDIYAEFENSVLVAQSASSGAIDRINSEIIESVKFRFLKNSILRKQSPGGSTNLLDLKKLQGKDSLHSTEEELLEDLLQDQVKHYRQLKFLASRHQRDILKLRFVLDPFSFVFLLSGEHKYHIVLETLDTAEATYLWHVEKDLAALKKNLASIEKDLELIRNKGRLSFLESPPENFSRVLHDYSEERKGFILWKDLLEERLV